MTTKRIAVIGGGIIGTAVARHLSRMVDGSQVTLFEKESDLAGHQTGHNSGVVHAGLYYEPGSLKARLCRRGVDLLAEYAAENNIAYDECGKVVVAHNNLELDRLHSIFERAKANGVPDVAIIDRDRLRELEPACTGGIAALHSPHTAIIDYPGLTRSLGKDVEAGGGQIRLSASVTGLVVTGSEVRISGTGFDTEAFDLVITCAGLQSDRLANAVTDRTGTPGKKDDGPQIVPFYGDYFLLRPERSSLVNGLIYPVPDPRYPFLGVHLTKRVDGAVMLGPNAFLSLARENYRNNAPNFRDLADTLTYPGFWKFAADNIPATLQQVRTAVSKKAFVEEARKFVPAIEAADVVKGVRGIRAQALNSDGSLVDDFVIRRTGRLVQVRNAPSPGATASLAIAEHIVEEALAQAG
jgi:L-2-hydroxyglutarate oxidase